MVFERIPGGKITQKREKKKDRNERTAEELAKFGQIEGRKTNEAEKVRIVEGVKILETRVFPKDEVLWVIKKVAKEEGFGPELLEIEQEVYDTEKNLIGLHMKVREAKAKSMGLSAIIYDFILKTTFARMEDAMDSEQPTLETFVMRIFISNRAEDTKGDIVARFQDNEWTYSPRHKATTEVNPRGDPDPDISA